jgi:uncharacterized protein (DUF1697 family)
VIYVALLRGINVGGKNLIKMPDLKASFEQLGLENVGTYIQSGNVLFSARRVEQAAPARIEGALSKAFNYESRVVVRSLRAMQAIVAKAPKGFGGDPSDYRYDVFFLREPLTAAEAMRTITTKDGVDQAFAGPGVLYFSRLVARLASSHASRIAGIPIYQNMTIRNWNTTTKLLSLMQEINAS